MQAVPLDGGNEVVNGPYFSLRHPFSGDRVVHSPASGRTAELSNLTGLTGADYFANTRVVVHDWSSGNVKYVTEPGEAPAHPSWSPDGGTLYFAAADGTSDAQTAGADLVDNRRIWSLDSDGSNRKQLTSDPRYRDEYPRVTPDGTQLLFIRVDLEEGNTASLWLLDLATGDLERVVDAIDNKWPGEWQLVVDWWQPQ
jgi:dipeptidyl aminopeptidase/acylaminoacyl peptidase